MALTLYEAAKMSRNPLTRGVFQTIVQPNQMLALLPMVRKTGESFMYTREKTLPSAEFVAPDHSSLSESSATFDRVTVPMRLLVSDVDVYDFVEEQMGDELAQRAYQIQKKLKAAGRKIADKLVNGGYATGVTLSPATGSPAAAITAIVSGPNVDSSRHGPGSIKYTHAGTLWQYRAPGDAFYGDAVAVAADSSGVVLKSGNPSKYVTVTVDVSEATANGEITMYVSSTTNEPDGLLKLIPASQTITSSGANGDALSFDILDQLIEKVKVRENLAFIMNGLLRRKFYGLLRGLGGTSPENMNLAAIAGSVPQYRGIPILINDDIASTEAKGGASTLSSVILASFTAEEGVWAGVSSVGEGEMVEASPARVRILGLKIRDVGELEAKEAKRTRVSWYGAFALGSELAAARASQLVTA